MAWLKWLDNSTGSPPRKAKQSFKEQTGWDWDANEEAYEKTQNASYVEWFNSYNLEEMLKK